MISNGGVASVRSGVRWSLATAILTVAGALFPGAIRAQLAVDRLEIEMMPGKPESHVGIVQVRNESDKPVQAVVKLEDWDRAEDGTNQWHPYGTLPGSCLDRLSIFPATIALDPGASADLRVTLDGAKPLGAECWGAAVVETAQDVGQGVRYLLRTAVKVYVLPEGLTRGGQVADLRLAKTPEGEPGVEMVFENTGSRHLITKGSLEIRRPDNTVAASVPLPDVYVLPGARGRAMVSMPKLPAGDYAILAVVDYGGGELAAMQLDHTVP
jgi:P pilus assembly chaperone PapD